MLGNLSRAVSSGEYRAPRTILTFLGAVLAIVASALVGLAVALDDDGLVIAAGIFFFALTAGLVVVVLIFAWKNPEKLMLGEVTARDYIAITKGDSVTGEYTGPEPVEGTAQEQITEDETGTHELPPGES